MKRKILALLTLCLTALMSLTGLTACNELSLPFPLELPSLSQLKELPQLQDLPQLSVQLNPEFPYLHIHVYDKEVVSEDFIASQATCDKKATYYYSCKCGDKGNRTFENGDLLAHSFVDGVCEGCSINFVDIAFDGGAGTEAQPYIIANVEQLENIAKVPNFSYFKVKDGVEELDLSGWATIDFNGCFDGNGVKLVNLTTQLFRKVGNYENKDIYIKNFEVNVNIVSTGSVALIKQISNFGITTFENVNIHGYIEGESNTAVLFSFGTKNGHETGSNYTVELKNVKSDVTLVCVTAQPLAMVVAHAFPGVDNKLTLKIDGQTEFTGSVYSAGDKKYNEYVAIGDYEIYVQDELITQAEIDAIQITKTVPVKGEEGYMLTIGENVSKVVVSITGQLTAYDENDEKIATKSGITMTFGTTEIVEGLDGTVKVFDLFDSATIVNNASELGFEIIDGVLTLCIAQNANYCEGAIRLQVQQYNAEGGIVSCGTLEIHKFVKEVQNAN